MIQRAFKGPCFNSSCLHLNPSSKLTKHVCVHRREIYQVLHVCIVSREAKLQEVQTSVPSNLTEQVQSELPPLCSCNVSNAARRHIWTRR